MTKAESQHPEVRVLVAEDNEDDYILTVSELQRTGWKVTSERVETAEDMLATLAQREWDLVISDFSMPRFSALGAIEIVNTHYPELPLIIVSGTIGEEAAVQALRAGAKDFLVKAQLSRLVPAVERELREARARAAGRAAEAALGRLRALYQQIVESSHEGIWIVDARELTTVFMNGRMAEVLGCHRDHVVGGSALDFVEEGSRREVEEWLHSPAQQRGGRRDLSLRTQHGRQVWVSASVGPLEDVANGAPGLLITALDVTDQRKLEAQVLENEHMVSIGMLAAGVGHEINNPLTSILANVDIVRMRLATGEPRGAEERESMRQELTEALEATERVRDIARDLKVFSRRPDERRAPVALARVLESSLRMARSETIRRARVVQQVADLPPVLGNESRLGQVFLNLIVNAAQAIPEGRPAENEIRLTAKVLDGDRVVVEVRDTGAGIPPENLSSLFTPFFTTKPPGIGTGLGLSICHRIITGLGGTITVDSAIGQGTSVRVTLPVAPAAPARSTPTGMPVPIPAPVPAGGTARVLVVDEDPLVGGAIARTLSPRYDVRVVEGGEAALSALHSEAGYALVVCDLSTSDERGDLAFDRIAESAQANGTAVLYLAAGASSPDGLKRRARAQWLSKPFDPRELIDKVASVLRADPRSDGSGGSVPSS